MGISSERIFLHPNCSDMPCSAGRLGHRFGLSLDDDYFTSHDCKNWSANAIVGNAQNKTRPRSNACAEYGEAVETYLFHELKSYVDYVSGEPLAFWKSKSGFEVDFILGDHTAIELKASENVGPNDLKSLKALAEERKLKRYLCVCLEARRRQVG